MMKMLTRYRFVLGILALNLILLPVAPKIGVHALRMSGANLVQMLFFLPPVFILLGLLDVWVDRETMTRLMGARSGLRGVSIALLLGSVAAGPLYGAFPVAGVLLRKGCTIANAIVFIGAWTTTKIPLILFESSVLGWKFMLARLLLDIPAVLLIAYLTDRALAGEERRSIYASAHMECDGSTPL